MVVSSWLTDHHSSAAHKVSLSIHRLIYNVVIPNCVYPDRTKKIEEDSFIIKISQVVSFVVVC
jgi:hypothetical protein